MKKNNWNLKQTAEKCHISEDDYYWIYKESNTEHLRKMLIEDLKELQQRDYLKDIHIATFMNILNKRFGYEVQNED